MVERGRSFRCFHDVEEADLAGVACQAIASTGPVGGYQQALGDQSGQD
jgi:hypothetical protein